MKSPQKTMTKVATKKVAVSGKATLTKKATKTLNVNFPVSKTLNPDDLEIRITIRGNEIVAKFYIKGISEVEQVVMVKPKPTPPPVTDDVIKALSQLKLNLKLQK